MKMELSLEGDIMIYVMAQRSRLVPIFTNLPIGFLLLGKLLPERGVGGLVILLAQLLEKDI